MNYPQPPVRAQPHGNAGGGRTLRGRLKLPMLLSGAGGLGLLACAACCALPILGAIGVGSGAMAFFKIVEPLSAGLLVLGAIGAAVLFMRVRRGKCGTSSRQSASCSADGSCGCGPAAHRLPESAER
jgi:hypothetical protein